MNDNNHKFEIIMVKNNPLTIFQNIDFHGSRIVYSDFQINVDLPLHDQILELQEDLLQVSYGQYTLDLGWYPASDPQGHFIIHIIENSDWSNPLYKKKASIRNLKKELEKAIQLVRALKD